jgi:serine/threonine-protein kinase RsbW
MPEPPSESKGDSVRYVEARDLATVRAFVRSGATALGLAAHRVELLALAVSELATNTLQHTTGGGLIWVFGENGQVVCDLLDDGPTRPVPEMPAASATRGRGLAIVSRVVDEVVAKTGPGGTLVRLRMNL